MGRVRGKCGKGDWFNYILNRKFNKLYLCSPRFQNKVNGFIFQNFSDVISEFCKKKEHSNL